MADQCGTIRLVKEYTKLTKRDPISWNNFVAHPEKNNMFKWNFLIFNLSNCPYEGGYYVGSLTFPPDYPMAPPRIMMHTPTGRFKTDTRLCLSISDYHPESWSCSWSIETVVIGLISFMN